MIARALTEAPVPAMLDRLDSALGDAAADPVLFVSDYSRAALAPLGPTQHISDEAVADTAFRSRRPARSGGRVALPLVHLGDPIGILVLSAADDAALVGALGDELAPLLGLALSTHFAADDRLERLRRSREMTLAAEIQWRLLPATTRRDGDVLLSAALEPAYETGGDVFDYSRHGSLLRFAVLDAMGHGFRAAVLSVAVTSSLRLARREGADLAELARRMTAAVDAWASGTAFVTAVMVDLDLSTGEIEWLTAGHVSPLRHGPAGLSALPHVPNLPLGVRLGDDQADPTVMTGHLDEGESLVLYSDGVVDNLAQAGEPSIDVCEATMWRTIEQHLAAGPTPGVAGRIVAELLDRTGPSLRDDATLLVVHPTG